MNISVEALEQGLTITVTPAVARRANGLASSLSLIGALVLLVAGAAAALTAGELGWGAPLAGICPSAAGLVLLALAGNGWLSARHTTTRVCIGPDEVRVERLHPLRRRADSIPRANLAVTVRPNAVDLSADGRTLTVGGLSPEQAEALHAALVRRL
ncbi:MAG: hypothetical protein ACI8PZ_002869 [Myxococcota bacterium]